MGLIASILILGICGSMGVVVTLTHNIYWGILTTIILLLVFVFKMHENENRVKFIEKKYGDDPDWKKYKELKRKFNNA